MPRPQRPPNGIEFPVNEKGERSTTEVAKSIWAAAFEPVDKDYAEKVRNEKNWRFGYSKHVVEHVRQSLKSKDNALNAAKAGIAKFYDDFEFIRGDKTMKFREAMDTITTHSFTTGVVKGNKEKPAKPAISVPYKGKNLQGEELVKQCYKWAEYGTIEKSAADAIVSVVQNNEWADLSDKYFVLLGAGAAMGPFLVLMALGANVIACDLDRDFIWKRLISVARDSCGTLTFPLKKPQEECANDDELFKNAGCDLLTQTPEIASWLKTVYTGKQLTIGSYVYLDGALFVKVSLACDAIIEQLCKSRKDTAVAFLCTPTDCHMIPESAHKAALANYNSSSIGNLLVKPIGSLSSKMLVHNAPKPIENEDGNGKLYYVDGLVVPQGPNYCLAKRLQHWRSIVERTSGHIVSTNIAPSTSTVSVVKNKQFAWAYDGMPFFKPMEIFGQETSNAVMAALLINDVFNTDSIAHPSQPLVNPLELFAHNSFHGGVWRTGYTIGSIGEVSVLIHFLKVGYPVLIALLLLIIVAFYFLF